MNVKLLCAQEKKKLPTDDFHVVFQSDMFWIVFELLAPEELMKNCVHFPVKYMLTR